MIITWELPESNSEAIIAAYESSKVRTWGPRSLNPKSPNKSVEPREYNAQKYVCVEASHGPNGGSMGSDLTPDSKTTRAFQRGLLRHETNPSSSNRSPHMVLSQ
jgi:hypothetical protein